MRMHNINITNKNIEMSSYEPIWLKFSFEDIKYIIVPNQSERIELVSFINGLSDKRIGDDIQKGVLISKIMVLDEIRKDW